MLQSLFKNIIFFFKRALYVFNKKDGYAEALNKKGHILLKKNELIEAEILFRNALKENPNLYDAKSNLGQVLRLSGRLAEAEKLLREAITLQPNDSIIYNRLGTTLRELGNDQDAELYYRQGLAINPNDADILNNLGSMLNQYGYINEAAYYFEEAIKHDSTHVIAKCNLCVTLSDRGLHDIADQCFIEAIAMDASYYYPRISYVMNKLYAIHDNVNSIETSRTLYENALIQLRDWLLKQDAAVLDTAAETVGWISPFYLTYQGKNDKYLQSIYGDLICKLMEHRYPNLTAPLTMPDITKEPFRIGIISAFFYDHSNWKTPIKGWLENINKERFNIFGYYTGSEQDEVTNQAQRLCYQFTTGTSFEVLATKIKEDALHVLIFPEISMNPITTKLAALRLAPIQCNSWGHPDTSGMPTIDYYLSSDLMEPQNGQSHYTEKLIRLPNLSIAYTPPNYNASPLTRNDLGLAQDKILYCCAQSLFKYLPQFDYIFIEIVKIVPTAQFVFFGHQKSHEITDAFTKRILDTFEKAGFNPSNHIVMLSRLNREEFQAALGLCDIYLDSVEWSGCNTTLEAFLCNIPVITYKGSMMRGRHTYSFLKMMGLDNLIANSLEEYIMLAANLGNNELLREKANLQIKNNFHKICGDTSCIHALEDFLLEHIQTYS